MKAGLPQKEGEEGDLEELCAINAYIPKRAFDPRTGVLTKHSYLSSGLLSLGRDINRGARREANLQIPTGQCKGAIALGPSGWG